jgi:hypothetical protein
VKVSKEMARKSWRSLKREPIALKKRKSSPARNVLFPKSCRLGIFPVGNVRTFSLSIDGEAYNLIRF